MKKLYICLIIVLCSMKGFAQFSEYGGTYYDYPSGQTGVIVTYNNPQPNNIGAQMDAQMAANAAAAASHIPTQPPIPPATGGSSGSPSTPNTPPPPPITPPDPCASAAKSDAKTSNAILAAQNASIKTQSTTTEFGAEQNLTSFPVTSTTGYKNIAVRSNGAAGSFSPNFTWDATNGYTIGVSHGHPGNGAPSPADLINAYGNLSNPQLVAGGQAAIDYYKANFTISVVTQNEIYTVSVTDWTALGTLYTAYKANPAAANTAWSNAAVAYRDANVGSSYGDYTAYAGLKLYGNAITITKKDNAAVKSTPLKIDSGGKVVKTTCP
jgi:hypothetical protein